MKNLKVGTKVKANGYDGTITRIDTLPPFSIESPLYEVRLNRGAIATGKESLTPLS